ncbi:MAG: hypothetical protein O7F72_08465 [Proteobacteria bacterium]|nr:hypothetical protein [Pseudomonadota bacterium]
MDMKGKIAPAIEYVAESTTACLVTMVQGNLLALTLSHVVIASQTGVIAGAIAAVALFASRKGNRWLVSAVLGVVTGIVDFFIHPGMFGPAATEAIVTGIAAGVLSCIIGTFVRNYRKSPATPD